ncbi:hypothetical protein V1477_020328 [Vespula maculifrons]|uniref:Uncharacterized protein n=1 Tax=Vespula maculifrons TaxID=7453 RepID=A0ABD2ALL6_VESMC
MLVELERENGNASSSGSTTTIIDKARRDEYIAVPLQTKTDGTLAELLARVFEGAPNRPWLMHERTTTLYESTSSTSQELAGKEEKGNKEAEEAEEAEEEEEEEEEEVLIGRNDIKRSVVIYRQWLHVEEKFPSKKSTSMEKERVKARDKNALNLRSLFLQALIHSNRLSTIVILFNLKRSINIIAIKSGKVHRGIITRGSAKSSVSDFRQRSSRENGIRRKYFTSSVTDSSAFMVE